MVKTYRIPTPVLNKKEIDSLEALTQKYKDMIEPGRLAKLTEKAKNLLPDKIKEIGGSVTDSISELEIYKQVLDVTANSFKKIEEIAARFTVSEKQIIKNINKYSKMVPIEEMDEICLLRSYNISKAVNNYKTQDILLAFAEGAGTGVAGLAGIPFNIALSNFLFFRAVQNVAMFYGYDVKNDSAELVIASQVYTTALSPSYNEVNNEFSDTITKIVMAGQTEILRKAQSKTWVELASKGGLPRLVTQVRALGNATAKKALESSGTKSIEASVFNEALEAIGKKLTQKTVERASLIFGAVLGAAFDTSMMNQVLEYADIFYQKRFLAEKELRIAYFLEEHNEKQFKEMIELDAEVLE